MENIYSNTERHNLDRSAAYTYDMLIYDIDKFKARYPSAPVFSIGKSVQGRNIIALKLGGGPKRIFICGAHHGMEWLTAKICMQFAIDIGNATTPPSPVGDTSPDKGRHNSGEGRDGNCGTTHRSFPTPPQQSVGCSVYDAPIAECRQAPFPTNGRSFREGTETLPYGQRKAFVGATLCGRPYENGGKGGTGEALRNGGVSVYIVPMVNPDGVELAAGGIKWQANANGVDLNHNYDALWELASQTEKKYGICAPCASKYGGAFPESEPESRAVADFTRENNFDLAVALHSQGEVIYYDFCGIVPPTTEEYLSRFESVSRYRRDLPEGTAICGGYKDWFIKKYKKPAFTIEVGLGKNPLPISQFDEVYEGVLPILQELVKA